MITNAEAARYEDASAAPTVLVGELWTRPAGDYMVFVEQAPRFR